MEKVFEWKFPPLSTFAVCYCEIVSADDYWVQLLLLESLMSDRISSQSKQSAFIFDSSWHVLTDGIFETGAYGVPSKLQNPIVLGQGGPSSTQCSNPNWACHCKEVRFASFLFGEFTSMTVINPPERKLAKRTSVHWCHLFGTNNYPPFRHTTQNQVFIPALDL